MSANPVSHPGSSDVSGSLVASLKRSPLLQLLLITLGYYLLGQLGLIFSINSSSASAIWPPAGFALATILILRIRAWPGIFFGALLINLQHMSDISTASDLFEALGLNLIMSCSAALQAVVGAYLMKRLGLFPNTLTSIREVMSFLFFGGILSSLISASTATWVMFHGGIIVDDNLWINWVTWWIGDTMGVFLFTPLMLVWFYQPEAGWYQRRTILSIPLLITFILVILLVTYGAKWEQQRIQSLFIQQADNHASNISEKFSDYIGVLHALKSFYLSSREISRDEFKVFTHHQLKAFPSLMALSWNPLIHHHQRQQYIDQIRQSGLEAFNLYERSDNGQLRIAAERERYVAVQFIEPLAENWQALGFDVYSNDKRREALDLARDHNIPVATQRLKLVQDQGDTFGTLIFLPVYHKDSDIENLNQRRQQLAGFMVAVIRLNDLFQSLLKQHKADDFLVIRLIDTDAPTSEQMLFQSDGTLDKHRTTLKDSRIITGKVIHEKNYSFNFAARNWKIQVLAGHQYIAKHRTENFALVLMTAFFLSAFIGSLTLIVSGRDGMLRRQISQRTKDLLESRKKLEEAQHIAHIGSWYLDWNSGEMEWSVELFKMYGLDSNKPIPTLTEIRQQTLSSDWRKIIRAANETFRIGNPFELEVQIITAKQDKSWIWIRGELDTDERGQVIGLHGTAQDITSRKRSELALRESENRMRSLFENAPLAYQSLDMGGNIIEVNNMWLAQTGYTRDQVIGKFVGDFISEDSVDVLQCEFPKFQHQGRVDGPIFKMERQDGSNFLWQVNGRIGHDEKGNPLRTHCLLTDVTEREKAQQALIQSEQKFRNYVENADIGIFITDSNGYYLDANPAVLELVGYSLEELKSKHITDLSPSARVDEYLKLSEQLKRDKKLNIEIDVLHKNGTEVPISFTGIILPDQKIMALCTDISERIQAEARMREALIVFNSSSQGIMTTDSDGMITSINPAFTQITGFTSDDVIGKTAGLLKSGRHEPEFYQEMWNTIKEHGQWEGEIWNRHKDGHIYPQWQTINRVTDEQDQVVEYIAMFSDITERKQQEEEIWRQANFDSLTGLANRNLLADRLERARAQANRNNNKLGLMFIDLDGFKWINDTLGHDTGDDLLIKVAQRINDTIRHMDTAARMGGDEFTIVIPNLNNIDDMREIGSKLVEVINRPFSLKGHLHQISSSVGITIYPDDGEDVQTLLKNADIAMYQAKQAGKNRYQFYAQHMQVNAQTRMEIEIGIRKAIKQNEFILYYQPVIDSDSGELVGAEALIRWNHPDKGIVSPVEFIHVAEESGLIIPIGTWVLSEAVRQWNEWRTLGYPELRISVNVSSYQFHQENFRQQVSELLNKFDMPAKYLVLEITETVLMDSSNEIEKRINAIKDLGILYALDDFGTGYSSLSYLKRFPVDIVKIDQSFVHDCPRDPSDAHLVEAIINMAQSLDLKVTAEGVETRAQFEFLRELSCDYLQGYLMSKPVDPDDFLRMMKLNRFSLPVDGSSIEESRFLAALREDHLDVEHWLQRLLIENNDYLTMFHDKNQWGMRGINLHEAVQNHLDWRRRLDHFVGASSEESLMSIEEAGSHSLCELGHWISDNLTDKEPCFVHLDRVHRIFHRMAGQIVDDEINGHHTLARRSLTGTAFRHASRDVVTALIDCYRRELQSHSENNDIKA